MDVPWAISAPPFRRARLLPHAPLGIARGRASVFALFAFLPGLIHPRPVRILPSLPRPRRHLPRHHHRRPRRPYGLNVPYRKLFARFEDILARHGGKPHWAKSHPLRPEALRRMYPRFDDFVRVLEEVDPHGMFRNPYVQRHIFGKEGGEYGARVFKQIQDKDQDQDAQ